MIEIQVFLVINLILLIMSLIVGTFILFEKKATKKLQGGYYLLAGVSSLGLITTIIYLWIANQKPPLQTLGETRIWYATMIPLIGFIINIKIKKAWPLYLCQLFSLLFLLIDYFNQSAFDSTLPPALKSPYFIPHVIVYILSYSILGAATLLASKNLIYSFKNKNDELEIKTTDNLIQIGYALLCMGLLFGALWAKEAWGHYWTWDPKETWAFITWMLYLIYLHLRYFYKEKKKLASSYLIFAFFMLIICWFGVNYLPTASQSVHTY